LFPASTRFLAISTPNTMKVRTAVDEIDILDLLPKVDVPTMVFHCRHDNVVPFEQGRLLAASIPNAKFVALESANHALLAREPAWTTFITEMEAFLADDG
jgi:pimeloyl-ACP methyl ester carboxylesterase